MNRQTGRVDDAYQFVVEISVIGALSHRSKMIAISEPRSVAPFSDWRSGDGAMAPVWSCARRSSARSRSNGKTPVFSNVVLPAPSAPYSTVRRERRRTSTSICASKSRECQAEWRLRSESSTPVSFLAAMSLLRNLRRESVHPTTIQHGPIACPTTTDLTSQYRHRTTAVRDAAVRLLLDGYCPTQRPPGRRRRPATA